jgi:peroxiredoxin
MSGRIRALGIAGLLALATLFVLLRSSTYDAPIEVGRSAPPFSLPALEGEEEVSLASLRGKVVLLNFWATWCKPCEDEMPAMERLYQALAGEPFELVAVSVDEDPGVVRAFRDRLDLSFPVLLDPRKRAAKAYQSFRFPESYLIDPSGVLVARYIGPREWDAPEYEARIRRLLDEGEGGAGAPARGPRYADAPLDGGRGNSP